MSEHINTIQVLDSCGTVRDKIVIFTNVCFVSEHARTSLLWFLLTSKLEIYLPLEMSLSHSLFSIFMDLCLIIAYFL